MIRQFVEGFPEYPVVAEQLPCADPDWRPLIPEWNELNMDVLGQALTQVITTDDPIQPIMDEANEKARAIMEREGYYSWASLPAAQVSTDRLAWGRVLEPARPNSPWATNAGPTW